MKRFEDLTLADDFMFCKVIQNEDICKELIEMILSDTIGTIAYISTQQHIQTYEQAKSVRFDILVQTEDGKFYDIEMPFSDIRPCLSENIEFCVPQNIAFIGNTGIHAGAQYSQKNAVLSSCY